MGGAHSIVFDQSNCSLESHAVVTCISHFGCFVQSGETLERYPGMAHPFSILASYLHASIANIHPYLAILTSYPHFTSCICNAFG